LAGAYLRWAEMTEEAKEMRVKIRRALNKMMKRELANAFEMWCDSVEDAKAGLYTECLHIVYPGTLTRCMQLTHRA
jgi:hypothetical protein